MFSILIFALLCFISLEKTYNLMTDELFCPQLQFFNTKTGVCECMPIYCGIDQIRSKCSCIKRCPNTQRDKCQQGPEWNEADCKYTSFRMSQQLCSSSQAEWSFTECRCVCRIASECTSPSIWNQELCQCTTSVLAQTVITNFINKPPCPAEYQECGPNQYWSNSRCQCI